MNKILTKIWNSDLRLPFGLIFVSIGFGALAFVFNEALDGDTVGLFSRSGCLIVLCGAAAEWRLYAIRDEQIVYPKGPGEYFRGGSKLESNSKTNSPSDHPHRMTSRMSDGSVSRLTPQWSLWYFAI